MNEQQTPPTLYVFAGPNGAGKTTMAMVHLPKFYSCREFVNADLIAAGLAPLAPETQNVRAARIMLERIDELATQRKSFGIETTLSGRTYGRVFERLKERGYRIHLYFLWLPSVELAIARVANRVRQGGHSIPEIDIRRRYESGIVNLRDRFQHLVDLWWLIDSSVPYSELIARREGEVLQVANRDLAHRLLEIEANAGETIDSRPSGYHMAMFATSAVAVSLKAKMTKTPIFEWREGRVWQSRPGGIKRNRPKRSE